MGWGVGGGYPDYIGLECLRVHVCMRNAGVLEDHSVALKELELVLSRRIQWHLTNCHCFLCVHSSS